MRFSAFLLVLVRNIPTPDVMADTNLQGAYIPQRL